MRRVPSSAAMTSRQLGAAAAGGALAMYCCGAMYHELPKPKPKRCAFVMQLEGEGDENLAEYIKRHDGTDPHWEGPKGYLHDVLSMNGVRNYSIHHLPSTNQLFAYAELDDDESFERVSKTEECAVWWKYFEEWGGMTYNDDPGSTSLGGKTPWADGLNEVFYME
eukprot:COSAG05_NODE_1239_length_5425_cov_3.841532_5_plen_165_part_00